MRLAGLLSVLALATACAVPRPFGEGVGLRTLVSGGYRVLDHEAFEHHPTITLAFATHDAGSGWGYETGLIYGKEHLEEARDQTGEFEEVFFGLRRSFRPDGAFQPYLGCGAAYGLVRRSLEDPKFRFQDEGGGAYARAGIQWKVGRFEFDQDSDVMLGIDLRSVVGNDYDSSELALVFGFGR